MKKLLLVLSVIAMASFLFVGCLGVTPEVNNPPEITSIAVTSSTVGEAYTYDVDATDPNEGDVLAYSLIAAPAGMTIDATTGVISWAPTAVGSFEVTVKASDQGELSDSQSFTLTVTPAIVPVNHAPVITSTAVTSVTLPAAYTYTVEATDEDGDDIIYSLTAKPAGMTIDATTGVIAWAPTTAGSFGVTVKASDGDLYDSQTFIITVLPAIVPVNHAPVITSTAVTSVTLPAAYTYTVEATDEDGDALTYDLIPLTGFVPAGMAISSAGVISWAPTTVGVYPVTVEVSDGELTDTQSFTVTVNPVPPVPVGPTVDSLLPSAATVGEAYVGQVTATAGDAAIASYALTDPPADMTIVAATGVVNWIPTAAGSFDVTVVVTDADGESDTAVLIIVVAARVAPAITAIANQPISWGEDFEYQVTLAAGTDLTPTYALAATRVPNAIGLAIDDETGLITWTPLEIQKGLYELTVTATDTYDSSLFDTEVFTILVEDPPVPVGPTVDSLLPLEATVGEAYVGEVTATAGDDETLTYSLVGAPGDMAINAETGEITWTPAVAGDQVVTVVVADGAGLSDSKDFTIVVAAAPVPPTVDSLLPLEATVGEAYVGQVAATPGGAAIASYALTDPPADMTIVAATGVVNWIPTAAGDQVVTVVVTDADGESGTEDFTIVVAARIAPEIAAIDDQTILWGEDFAYQVTLAAGTDLTPSYALAATRVPNAIGLAIDPETGEITWTPIEFQVGLYEVTVTATDTYDSSLFDTEVFTIFVEDPPPPPLPPTLEVTGIVYGPENAYTNGTVYVKGWVEDGDCVPVEVTFNLPVEEDVQIRWNDGNLGAESSVCGSSSNLGWVDLEGNEAKTVFTGCLPFDVSLDDCETVCVEVRRHTEEVSDPCCPIVPEFCDMIYTDIVTVDSAAPCASFIVTFADCEVDPCDPIPGASMSWTTDCSDEVDCYPVYGDCCGDCSGIASWSFVLDFVDGGECDPDEWCAEFGHEQDCPINGNFPCGCLLYEGAGDPSSDGIHTVDITIIDNVGNEFIDTWTIIFDTDEVTEFTFEGGITNAVFDVDDGTWSLDYGCEWEDCEECMPSNG